MVDYKVLISIIFISIVFSRLEALADGAYRIRCHTKNHGILALESFVGKNKIRPRTDTRHQDQKWMVQSVEDGKYKISCWTQNGGKRFLEAYPKGDGFLRPSVENLTPDQLWEITPWPLNDGFYRISCNTVGRGMKSIEAFGGNDIVRVKGNSLHQDQSWEFIPW